MITAPSAFRKLADMSADSRVWIYKSARDLGKAEQRLIAEQAAVFTANWAAHGEALDACVEVLEDRFIVIAADEATVEASGCSIDKSVAFIKELEHDLNLMLTDRMLVIYRVGDNLATCFLHQLPAMLAEGLISLETVVYDDLVSTVGELRTGFTVPLGQSWMKRFLQ